MKSVINHLIVMGDSLSDRGTLAKRHEFGVIPMNTLSGLQAKKSPFGRFTNGYNWIDTIAQRLHNMFAQEESEQEESKQQAVLNDDKQVLFKDKVLLRSYAEGGLTSYSYTNRPVCPYSVNIPGLIGEQLSRLMVSNLHEKRTLLLQDDEAHALNKEHKSHTLIMEWSGANDLITVNLEPNVTAINHSIASRIANLKALIKKGYRNFIFFNLPDLSLTPYYQHQPKPAQRNAKAMSERYNQKLETALKQVQEEYQDSCQIELLDINQHFSLIYANPADYGFDKEKITDFYTESHEFKTKGNNGSSKGHMFWDAIHPSEDMHKKLADHALAFINNKFTLISPTNEAAKNNVHHQLFTNFCYEFDVYNHKNKTAMLGIYGLFSYTTLTLDKSLSASFNLEKIIHHGLTLKNYHTLQVFKALGWVDESLKLTADSPIALLQIEEQRQEVFSKHY